MQHRDVIFNSDMSGVRLHLGLQAKMSRLRSHRGMPDLMIYEKRGNFGALFLELKPDGTRILRKDKQLTANVHIREQAEILMKLTLKGYCANFAVGIDEAMAVINWYLEPEALFMVTAYPGVDYLKPLRNGIRTK